MAELVGALAGRMGGTLEGKADAYQNPVMTIDQKAKFAGSSGCDTLLRALSVRTQES